VDGARTAQGVIAVDTNVLVRVLTLDDQQQADVALDLMDRNQVFVSLMALLETEWVLRSSHGYSRAQTATALRTLFTLPMVVVEQSPFALWAIDRHAAGGDLADMLLLIAARETSAFATFDRRLERRAGRDTPVPITTLR
jgi:predicted nucleic-acid-binding protein